MDVLAATFQYHEETKHHPHRFARSLGYLDWETQPDPFRRFEGAPRVDLPRPEGRAGVTFDALGRSPARPASAVTLESLGAFLYDSLAISAWKQVGDSPPWALRVNPSSGNLHPTEGYLITGAIEGLCTEPATHHYWAYRHGLERRVKLPDEAWAALAGERSGGRFFVGLTSILWREAWKYGERAFRYCQHDTGHAIAAIGYAAAIQGWRARLVEGIGDATLERLMGCGPETWIEGEGEHVECLIAIDVDDMGMQSASDFAGDGVHEFMQGAKVLGSPNRLSGEHVDWPIIDEAAAATRRAHVGNGGGGERPAWLISQSPCEAVKAKERVDGEDARVLIRRRRSAVAMDGVSSLQLAEFVGLMARVTPASAALPSGLLPWRPQVALVLMVHRVKGLDPGLYVLVRNPAQEASLRGALNPAFDWESVGGVAEGLGLFRLALGDARLAAGQICCQQSIAADGAFAVAMLARFEPALREAGAWFYRRLFWETGLIGQALYLGAEAAGTRATGIGCYFDDAMHSLLGIRTREWQSLYHFTVGGAVDDPRLKTIAPYGHLERAPDSSADDSEVA